MIDKEHIIVDGVLFDEAGDFLVDYNLNGKFQNVSSFAKEYIILKHLIEQLIQKTQECEELKEEIQKLEMEFCNECGEKDDYNIPCRMIRNLNYVLVKEFEVNDRYRKALEEIEGLISDDEFVRCPIDDDVNCNYFTRNKILNIINKVKED